jgi:pilin isopeptide linkage protein
MKRTGMHLAKCRGGGKRLRAALAVVLALSLSVMVGGVAFAVSGGAFAMGSDAAAIAASAAGTGADAASAANAASATSDNPAGFGASVESGAAVADSSTIWDWEKLIGYDTSSVGRIWTDKTVTTEDMTRDGITVSKGDSDFLTGLTALSSTSNLSSTQTQPLDIVLVLDVSRSMGQNNMGDVTRMAALQSAVNSFIDKIADQNAKISDASKQHEVALVKFAGNKTDAVGNDTYNDGRDSGINYSQVVKSLGVCTSDTKESFKTDVSALKPGGTTNSEAGLELASGVSSKRTDAKKVIIFFTDGLPTAVDHGGVWSDDVASGAVNAAKDMKTAGATVYAIGVFDKADPATGPTASDASSENKFMHAVSSNYKTATYAQATDAVGYAWDFGDRTKDAQGNDAAYYKSATSASELSQVFDDIGTEITQNAGYPTKTRQGFENESGYITFDDELGQYMQVDDVPALVYDGKPYTYASKSTTDGMTTYHFQGDVHSGAADADLSDIVVTVTKSDRVSQGDKVQVKIPATLIPLRNFTIDLTDNTMTKGTTAPMTLFYTSSVKPETAALLANPDADMQEYLSDSRNYSEGGEVNFYANMWTHGDCGDSTATFEPASTNSYYYFTEDTPIYSDADCTTRATSIEGGNTYYYEQSYYKMVDNGKPVAASSKVAFPGADAAGFAGAIGTDSDGCYFKAGTAKLVYINELHSEKGSGNLSETAAYTLDPQWNSTTRAADATRVTSYLGGNGKLTAARPATLEVSKELAVPEGYDATKFADVAFDFEISVPEAAGNMLNAQVYDAQGLAVGDAFTLTLDEEGLATHSLKAGERLCVFGMDPGWKYSVSEIARDGFTQIAPVDSTGAAVAATGEFAAGQTAQAAFTNLYVAPPVSYDTVQAGLNKVLTGRDWLDSDSFTFAIEALDGGPLPMDANGEPVTQAVATRASGGAFDFGKLVFMQEMLAGCEDGTRTFTYAVTEDAGGIPGVAYSSATATVKVTLTDNFAGKLTATVAVENPTFTNEYRTTLSYTAAGGLNVTKTLLGRDMAQGQFSIDVVPMDADSAAALGISADGERVAMPAAAEGEEALVNVLAGRDVAFTQDDAGKTFSYRVYEVYRDGAAGYTFDAAERTVSIAVTDDPTKAALTATTTVSGGIGGTHTFVYTTTGAVGGAAVVPFENSYFASTDVPGGTAAAVSADKVLTGRDLAVGEFSFGVRLAGTAGEDGAAGGDVLAAVNAVDGTVDFGSLSYTTDSLASLVEGGYATRSVAADGSPVWTVGYVAYERTDGLAEVGVTAKTTPVAFTVTVVDNGDGTLTATTNMPDGGFVFENQYSTGDPVAVDVTGKKVLAYADGLTPNDITGKFTFTISSSDPAAPMPTVATTTNDANGNVIFGAIEFSLEDLNRALGEVATAEPAANADAAANAALASDAEEVANTASAGAANEAANVNVNADVADAASEAATGATSKASTGNAADAATNTATASDATTNAAKAATADESSGNVPAQVADEPASETPAAPTPRSYTFEYAITETGAVPGVANDMATKTVSIMVTDDGKGNLTAELVGVPENEPAFTFTNTYSVEPVTTSVTDQIAVTKTLTGRDMVAGEFTFELVEGDEVVATGTNDAAGKVVFDAIEYAKPGTHQYTIREAGGGTKANGVTYDGATYQVSTVISDNGKGGLTAKHTLEGDASAAAFANVYAPEPTTVIVGATKVLTGKDLTEDQFTFKLTGSDGIELIAKNKADGSVAFPAISYDAAGVYEYEVSEVDDAQDNVTYDEATYQVIVTVTDDLRGHLSATVSSGGVDAAGTDGTAAVPAIVFNNTYVEPMLTPTPTPTDDTPTTVTPTKSGDTGTSAAKAAPAATATAVKTGDDLLLAGAIIGVIAAAAGAIALLMRVLRRV